MNKKGFTILELIISLALISSVILLLLKVLFSLDNINSSNTYASDDEIKRAEVIKNIETDFLSLKLNGLDIVKERSKTTIKFMYKYMVKDLVIEEDKLKYDKETYSLESNKATYSLCPSYKYKDLDDNYYLVEIVIPVLIDGKKTAKKDDITLTYLSKKNSDTNFLKDFQC